MHLSFALPPSGRLYGVRLQRSYCAGLSATLEFRLQHRRFVEVRLLLSRPDIGLTQSAKTALDLHIDPFALGKLYPMCEADAVLDAVLLYYPCHTRLYECSLSLSTIVALRICRKASLLI